MCCVCRHMPRTARDLVGRRFGTLTVEARLENARNGRTLQWRCRCDCGAVVNKLSYQLSADRVVCGRSCASFISLRDASIMRAMAGHAGDAADERWLPIEGHLGYEVSDLGRVRTWRPKNAFAEAPSEPRVLAKVANDKGYIVATLGRRQVLVHIEVLRAFVGPCPEGMEGCHNNGVRDDSRLSNLRWGTHQSNMDDQISHGTRARGSRQGNARLTEEIVAAIRAAKGRLKDIAERFGVSQSSARKIRQGFSWQHVSAATSTQERWETAARGEGHGMAKLTRAQVDEMRRSTESLSVLAVRYGISKGHASFLRSGRGWATDGDAAKRRVRRR